MTFYMEFCSPIYKLITQEFLKMLIIVGLMKNEISALQGRMVFSLI